MAEVTHNAIDVLAGISGLSKEAVKEIAEEAKANVARLNSCSRHDFQPVGRRAFADDYVCQHCQGKVNSSSFRWYSDGLIHASAEADALRAAIAEHQEECPFSEPQMDLDGRVIR